MKILENVDNSKFESALSIAKKYGYRLDDLRNKPDNYMLRSSGLFGFTVSYGTRPAMIVPTITIGGTVNGEVDRVIQQRDKLNIAIELAKELEKLYSKQLTNESVIDGWFIFRPDSQLLQELPECDQYDGSKCKIVGVDVEGPYGVEELNSNYFTIEFEDGTEMSAISGSCLKKSNSEKVVKESIKRHRETFRLNGISFSVTFDGDSVRMRSYRPYDDAEYHYAISKDGGEQFSIYRDRKFIEQFAPFSFDEDEESGIRNFNWNEVARELLRLDKDVESRMMHN